eukprot:NODE_35_length_36362_cov_0.944434.p2 type:complete len:708 gc:universal NODE_35_length_36362_cov_0.944434:7746-9869(+)
MFVSVYNLFEIAIMGIQFLSLTASYNVVWNNDWIGIAKVLSFFTQIPITEDVRIQHGYISCLFPLVISLIVLLTFKPLFTVFKDVVSLFCWAGLGFGIYESTSKENVSLGFQLISICGAILGILLAEAIIKKLWKRRAKKLNRAESFDTEPDDSNKKPFWKQLRNLSLSGIFIFVAILAIQSSQSWWYILILFACSSLLLYNFISNLVPKGRELNSKINYLFRKHTTKIILTILSAFYIPLTLDCLQFILPSKYLLYGKDITCTSNQIIKMKMPFPPATFDSLMCLESFNNNTNHVSLKMSNYHLSVDLNQERFYQSDTTIPLYSEVYPYLFPSSFIIFALVSIGLPFLYYKLVNICYIYLQELPKYNISEKSQDWGVASKLSSNCCNSLYCNLNEKFKDFKLMMLAFRLLVVIVTSATYVPNIEGNGSQYVFIILVFVHFVILASEIYFRPFTNYTENFFLFGFQFVNLVFVIFATLSAYRTNLPAVLPFVTLAVIILVPILAIIVGFSYDLYIKKKKTEIDASFTNVDASKVILDLDMKIDKKLQSLVVFYFATLYGLIFVGSAVYYYGTTKNFFTFRFSNGRTNGNMEVTLKEMTSLEDKFQFGRSCEDISILLKNCNCVNIPQVYKLNSTEVWKCDQVAYADQLLILERTTESNFMDLNFKIRPFCSNQFDTNYLLSNMTLRKEPIADLVNFDDFNSEWIKFC